MATASRRKRANAAATAASLADDMAATRAVWSEHMEVIAPTAMGLAADVGKMLVDLSHSPLGQRARRHPEISFAIGALSLGLVARLFRCR